MTERKQLDAELVAIAAHLPGRWQLDPKYADHVWCAVLLDDAGHGLHFNMTAPKGRLQIRGLWPRAQQKRQQKRQHIPDKCPHISVARNRPPEKIAAEISRRLLPWYLTAYADQAKRAQTADTGRKQQQEAARELAAIVGQESQLHSDPASIYTPNLTVDVHNSNSVTIQLCYISLKTAQAVLRAIVKAGGLTK